MKKEKNLKKSERGITLIALMITIIVLLILAGVTLSLTLGERGIFRVAKEAGKNWMNAQDEEEDILAGYENEVNKWIGANEGETSDSTPEEYFIYYEESGGIVLKSSYNYYFGNSTVLGHVCGLKTVVVPSSFNGHQVTCIGETLVGGRLRRRSPRNKC